MAVKFIAENKLPFVFLEETKGTISIDSDIYKNYAHPVSVLIGKDGKAYYFHVGFESEDITKYKKEIVELLNK